MKELIKRLRKILDTVQMADDLRKRLERLLEALEGGEPTDIVIARLLADLLELGADRLPGPVGDFVKAYAEAFRNAIDAILAVLWKRYREARRAGLDHQEANDLVTFDAKICEWLRFRWLLEQFDESREAAGDGEREEIPGGLIPGPFDPPEGEPEPLPPVQLWDDEHDGCCRGLSARQREPVASIIHERVYREGGSWYIDAIIEITHRCGLKFGGVRALYINIGSGAIKLQRHYATESAAVGGRGKRYTWRRLQVSAQQPREILVHVRAVSACIGVLDRMVRIG